MRALRLKRSARSEESNGSPHEFNRTQDQRNAATPTNIQAGSKLAGVLAGLQKGDRERAM